MARTKQLNTQTLVEKALECPRKKHGKQLFGDDEIDLAIAIARGEVTLRQGCHALGKPINPNNMAYWAFRALSLALQTGAIVRAKARP